jgi:hypothetical protein
MTRGLERRYGLGHHHFVTFSCYGDGWATRQGCQFNNLRDTHIESRHPWEWTYH